MKTMAKQSKRRAAFTIVELLTVMSIIVILIGLLVPALNRVRIFAREVKQNAQFHSIEAAIELFNSTFDGYPESFGTDLSGNEYCGAMKLCEAMMGQDVLGFHTDSLFDADGSALYTPTTLPSRKGPFLPPESADAVEVGKIWTDNAGNPAVGSFLVGSRALCDVYTRKLDSGEKVGMPILYYKADTTGTAVLHDSSLAMTMDYRDSKGNIYNYLDNQDLLDLDVPRSGAIFPLGDPDRFYKNTLSSKVTTVDRPFKADSYILISAGYDALYGTADDICNFEWKYNPVLP